MADRTGKVYICKDINLDKEYVNVLNYTEAQMLTLLESSSHLVASKTNCSFVRPHTNQLIIEVPYGTALTCNYLAFQNPDYSNKWFFAFIDEVIYVGETTTQINFTIDEHSTWFDYWDAKACLVLRETVADDSIGLHTYPENIETGPYICNSYEELGGFSVANSKIIVGTTWLPSNTPNLPSAPVYGGVLSGLYYVAFPYTGGDAKKLLQAFDGLGRGDAIVTIFMAPNSLVVNTTSFTGDITSKITNMDGTTSNHTFTISGEFIGSNYGGAIILSDKTITQQTTLNGYTPKNKKMLCFPFNYLLVTNNCGSTAEYHYEDFINNLPTFNINGTLCPGCSIKLYPENYKKIADGTSTRPGYDYGLVGGKFPICSWQNDSFTNWMTQQSVNHTTTFFGEALSLGTGALTGGEWSTSMGLSNENIVGTLANYMNQVYQHALVSPQQSGSLNGGDVTFAIDELNFGVYKMSVKAEYAEMCDNYFTKYGYAINKIKVPNMVSRTYWNYLQIGKQDDIGYSNSSGSVPASSMNIINNIYRKGVTIWHSHDNIGNYSLNNTIVSS